MTTPSTIEGLSPLVAQGAAAIQLLAGGKPGGGVRRRRLGRPRNPLVGHPKLLTRERVTREPEAFERR